MSLASIECCAFLDIKAMSLPFTHSQGFGFGLLYFVFAFSALTLLVGRQEGQGYLS